MSNVCQGSSVDFPDAGGGMCCAGAAMFGPDRCTCWVPVYDLEQQPLNEELKRFLAAGIQPVTRRRMCEDCAYRPGSPEKSGDPNYAGDADELERLAEADRFWCHQGMRRPLRWRHPSSGVEIDGHPGSYQPPIVDGVPYRADGTPGELCAGWDARRRALTAETTTDTEEVTSHG